MSERRRLDPAVFALPVERMREGYYTDAYFNFSKRVLETRDEHPRVLMQVFQKYESAVLGRHGRSDRRPAPVLGPARRARRPAHLGRRLGRARGEGALRRRRHRAVGDRHDDRGRLLAVRPPRDGLSRRAHAAHADLDERAPGRRGRRRQADPLLSGALRPLPGAGRRRLGGAHRRRHRRLDRRAGVVVGRQGRRHGAARSDRGLRRRHGARLRRRSPTSCTPTSTSSPWSTSTTTAWRPRSPARAPSETRLWGVRLDTSETMVDRSLWENMGQFRPTGVTPELVRNVRRALDGEGFAHVRIVVSGGFDAGRIARVRADRRAGRRLRRRFEPAARQGRLYGRCRAGRRPAVRQARALRAAEPAPRAGVG